jgi:tRNA A-37 threonylcarbamoyl transferase component Bud32
MSVNDAENSLEGGATYSGAAKRQQGEDNSLGGEATCAGQGRRQREDVSLGDERTLGGDVSDLDTAMDDIEVVDLASRYRTEGTLGRGGMGEVLLATDTRLERKVAIKRILGEAARSRTAVNRFLVEAKSIAALNHPNIVQIYDYGRAADGPFLIMEYVDGSSLLDRCRGEPIPLDEAVELACQLCDGLAKAHDLGIIHRDIKPANVLLTKDGTPKLTDFGLAKAEANDHGQTMTGAVLGTPDFMPPEQRRDASLVDARSDLWSLAATVYQMVTGKSPKIIRFKDVPGAIQEVLGRALEDEKDARYPTVREFRDALKVSLRAAAAPVAIALGEGQCPGCGTKNDSSRKFCRNCGGSLEAPCLACDKGMPYWEEICGQCGTKQEPLIAERRSAMAARQAEAESLLNDLDFEAADRIAVAINGERDPRFNQFVGWAEKFLPRIQRSRDEQQLRADKIVADALRHDQAFDYLSAIHTLEQVPASFRQDVLPDDVLTVAEKLSQLNVKQSECMRLEQRIKNALVGKEYATLLTDVEKLLRLKPDRQDIATIKARLEERTNNLTLQRDRAVRLAHELIAKHDYAGAAAALDAIDPAVSSLASEKLVHEVRKRIQSIKDLRTRIKLAVSQKQYDGLLRDVDALLVLSPSSQDGLALRASLLKRQKELDSRLNAAMADSVLFARQCNFGSAVDALRNLPTELLSTKLAADLCTYESLRDARMLAHAEVSTALNSDPPAALKNNLAYMNLLGEHGFVDQEYLDKAAQHDDRQRAWEIRTQRIKQLEVASKVLTGLVLFAIAVGVVLAQSAFIASFGMTGKDALVFKVLLILALSAPVAWWVWLKVRGE